MDKCHQDKYCLDKCHCDSLNLFKMAPGTYISNLIEIGSVTAEILLKLSFWWGWWVVVDQSHSYVKL